MGAIAVTKKTPTFSKNVWGIPPVYNGRTQNYQPPASRMIKGIMQLYQIWDSWGIQFEEHPCAQDLICYE